MRPRAAATSIGPPRRTALLAGLASLAALLCAGCNDIDTTYGRRANTSSVNGTSVLGDMFAEAGHEVSSWPWLSPRLSTDADVIVWFPDDFAPPAIEVRDWLESWLLAKPGRTLIYVARDYDAGSDYWQRIRVGAQGEQYAEFSRKLAAARSEFAADRMALPADEDADWFKIDGKLQPRTVRSLSGNSDWLVDIDPAKTEIELNSRLLPAGGDEILLESNGDALITRSEWGDSQLLVVTNGSLFLNLKLVNHEHRKLAGHLIDAVGQPPRKVYFLDSSTPQARIYQEEPQRRSGNPLERIFREPLDHIALQLALLGLLFAWSRLPIFGIPRKVEPPRLADFGQHVAALGELLEATRDEQYALDKLQAYRQAVRHDSLRGRLSPRATPAAPTLGPAAAAPNAETPQSEASTSAARHSQAPTSAARPPEVATDPTAPDNPLTPPPPSA